MKLCLYTIIATTLLLSPVFRVLAETSCGNIIVPSGSEEDITPILNCNNPFNADETVNFTYKVRLNDTEIQNGSELSLPTNTTTTVTGHFSYEYPDAYGGGYVQLFKKVGNDYRLVQASGAGDFSWNNVEPGEYVGTAVFSFNPVLNDSGLLERLFAWVIPSAIAYNEDYVEVAQFAFTITAPPPKTGASSVLFLPGILGSHLYEENAECEDGDYPLEKRRWLSKTDCDQLRLQTNVIGKSINNIYTYSGEQGIVAETYTFNVYKSFIAALKAWRSDGVIKEFSLVPYDWRLSISDILLSMQDPATGQVKANVASTIQEGYLYKQLERLVPESLSGKVTIVAHSNGGLVAKQFLTELNRTNDPLLSKIDNLILVAVPQVGTPDAVWAVLHGTELGYGLVMSNKTSRQLLNTMPFAHHLLPNQNYFNSVSTPVIAFEAGEATNVWRSSYGNQINDRGNLHRFLDKNSGRSNPQADDLLTPEIVDSALLNYAEVQEIIQGNWEVPTGLKIYQVAGTGLETPSGLTYFTDRECIARNPLLLFRCTQYAPKLGYRVNMTIDGDKTVVVPSALTLSGEKWWVNLLDYNEVETNREHGSILEVEDLRKFIRNIISSETPPEYDFITNSAPIFPENNRLVFQLHSPLDLSVVTKTGIVSSTTNEVEGAEYRRFGEVQYLSLPGDTKDVVVQLKGLANGSFTLDVEKIEHNKPVKRQTYSAVPIATTTRATLKVGDIANLDTAVLNIDYDGNGAVDIKYNTGGEIIETVSYQELITAINALQLRTKYKHDLIATARLAQNCSPKTRPAKLFKQLERATLLILKQKILLLERQKLITKQESANIVDIINGLTGG